MRIHFYAARTLTARDRPVWKIFGQTSGIFGEGKNFFWRELNPAATAPSMICAASPATPMIQSTLPDFLPQQLLLHEWSSALAVPSSRISPAAECGAEIQALPREAPSSRAALQGSSCSYR